MAQNIILIKLLFLLKSVSLDVEESWMFTMIFSQNLLKKAKENTSLSNTKSKAENVSLHKLSSKAKQINI